MSTFIEVCAGCGGLSSGFLDAGFVPILLNEIDPTCCQTLRENHPGVTVLQSDLRTLQLTEYRGRVDVLMGGVPCQSFSHAGERRGLEDPRGQLIVEFNRLILECQPKVVLVENVKGLVTHEGGQTLRNVLSLFANDGQYRTTYKVLNSVDYNVPQKRERVIIICVRSDIPHEFVYPQKSDRQVVLRDVLVGVPQSVGAVYPESKRRVMERIPQGGYWIHLPEATQREYMGASYFAGGGKTGIARRLSMDQPSLTLTTSPSQKQTERCHPIETRPLTVREYARIQTFPDTYTFAGSMAAQYKQIGNAVPVQLAHAIATSVRQLLQQANPA